MQAWQGSTDDGLPDGGNVADRAVQVQLEDHGGVGLGSEGEVAFVVCRGGVRGARGSLARFNAHCPNGDSHRVGD